MAITTVNLHRSFPQPPSLLHHHRHVTPLSLHFNHTYTHTYTHKIIPTPPLRSLRTLASTDSGAGGISGDGGGISGGGGGGDEGGDDAEERNKKEAMIVLTEAGRSLESVSEDVATAIKAGRLPGNIVKRYIELERSVVFKWLLQFGGFKERLLADDLFLTKVGIECGVGIFTKVLS